jgi:Sporulation delaying protein SdpA
MLSARGFVLTATALLVTLIVTSGAQLPSGLAPGWLHRQHDTYQAIWPQGWSYFATPDGVTTTGVYRPSADNRRYTVATQPLTSTENLGGLSRRGSAQFVIVMSVERRVPVTDWRPCAASTVDGCAGPLASAPAVAIDNHLAWPPLCGRFVLTHERAGNPDRRIVAVARVELTCTG